MNATLSEWIAEVPERERVYAQEQLIVAVAESIWEKMEEREVSKAAIAKALGKSKAFITQCLNGSRNMTLRTLSDIAFALGAKVKIEFATNQGVVAHGAMLSFEAPDVAGAAHWESAKAARLVTDVVTEASLSHTAADSGATIEGDSTRAYWRKAA